MPRISSILSTKNKTFTLLSSPPSFPFFSFSPIVTYLFFSRSYFYYSHDLTYSFVTLETSFDWISFILSIFYPAFEGLVLFCSCMKGGLGCFLACFGADWMGGRWTSGIWRDSKREDWVWSLEPLKSLMGEIDSSS